MVDIGRRSDKLYFRYKAETAETLNGKEVQILKPKIQVVFRRFSESRDPEKNREFPTFALVDSGADYSFLPLKIAHILRLDIEETEEKILTIAGPANVFRSKVHLEIPQRGMRPVIIGEIPIHILAQEVDEKYLYKMIVLGRNGFFEKYLITFNETGKNMMFKDIHKDEQKIRKSNPK